MASAPKRLAHADELADVGHETVDHRRLLRGPAAGFRRVREDPDNLQPVRSIHADAPRAGQGFDFATRRIPDRQMSAGSPARLIDQGGRLSPATVVQHRFVQRIDDTFIQGVFMMYLSWGERCCTFADHLFTRNGIKTLY